MYVLFTNMCAKKRVNTCLCNERTNERKH